MYPREGYESVVIVIARRRSAFPSQGFFFRVGMGEKSFLPNSISAPERALFLIHDNRSGLWKIRDGSRERGGGGSLSKFW